MSPTTDRVAVNVDGSIRVHIDEIDRKLNNLREVARRNWEVARQNLEVARRNRRRNQENREVRRNQENREARRNQENKYRRHRKRHVYSGGPRGTLQVSPGMFLTYEKSLLTASKLQIRRHLAATHGNRLVVFSSTLPQFRPIRDVRGPAGKHSAFLIKSSQTVEIPAGKNVLVETGIYATVPENHQMILSILPKYAEKGLFVTYGIIDRTNESVWTARVQNMGQETVVINNGDNVFHGTLSKVMVCNPLVE